MVGARCNVQKRPGALGLAGTRKQHSLTELDTPIVGLPRNLLVKHVDLFFKRDSAGVGLAKVLQR